MRPSVAQGKEHWLECISFSRCKEITGRKGLINNCLVFKASDEQTPFWLHFIMQIGGDDRRRKEDLLCPWTTDSSSLRLQLFTASETQTSNHHLSFKRLPRAKCKHLTVLTPINTEHCYFWVVLQHSFLGVTTGTPHHGIWATFDEIKRL